MKYLLTGVLLLSPVLGTAEDNVLYIYQDADLSNSAESSEAIQKGIELAFDEIGNEIEGYKVEFKYLDHRGNVVRSKQNFQVFIDDPKALAIFSGIHSAPLIKNRDFINDQKALTLVPWAAGGPITRYPSSENWVFRLSVDDTQAGQVIIDFALHNRNCKSPRLVLEETPWGNSNLKSMSEALKEKNIDNIPVTRFSWNLKKIGARAILRDAISQGNDCIVLVANTGEGIVLAKEMLGLPLEKRLPIISHWGITGGNFSDVVTQEERQGLDLHFIQTCFAFTNSNQSALAKKVFSRLTKYTQGAISSPGDIKPAVGFIHAYDLTKILIQAIKQTGLTGNVAYDRNALRLALENLQEPVNGLVKSYKKPFSVFNEQTNVNAHEALNADHYCMGRYGPDNDIQIYQD